MALDPFSIPPFSIPGIGTPGPPDIPPDEPPPTDSFDPPSITFPFPSPFPTTTVDPVPPTTVAPSPPTESLPVSRSSSLSSSILSSSRQVASTSISSLPPASSPPSNIGAHTTSTSTFTAPSPPSTGRLSPSQPAMSFLQNKGARAGVFSVAAIVVISIILGIGAMIYRRKKRKQFDLDHVEAMAGYHNRAPIDGDYDYPSQSSHAHTNTSYHNYSHTDELAPSYSYHGMRERHIDDSPYPVSPYFSASGTYHEESDPYRENPFGDFQPSPTRNGFGSRPLDNEVDDDYKTGSEESNLQPPQRWPQLAQLPAAFGNRSSEVIEQPRALRVTNGLDESHA